MLSAWCGMQQLGSFAIGFPLHNHVDMCCDLTDAQQANDGTPKAAGKAEPTDSDGSEPPLNEDDDDELDDTDQGDEELKTNHLVLAQFDKVLQLVPYSKLEEIQHNNDQLVQKEWVGKKQKQLLLWHGNYFCYRIATKHLLVLNQTVDF